MDDGHHEVDRYVSSDNPVYGRTNNPWNRVRRRNQHFQRAVGATGSAGCSDFVPRVHHSRATSTTSRPKAVTAIWNRKPTTASSRPTAVINGQMLTVAAAV